MTIPRLAVYGSLAPGEPNHHVLAAVPGDWMDGVVQGTLRERGWGASHGFPGLEWHPDGPPVPVRVLTGSGLAPHLGRLDAFEGEDYRRTAVTVELDGGARAVTWIYLIRWTDPDLDPVLERLAGAAEHAGTPWQVTGGLAARGWGAERMLVDVDIWVPEVALPDLLAALDAPVIREPAPHRDDHWDLTFAAADVGGVRVEVAAADNARWHDRADGTWRPAAVEFTRPATGRFQGAVFPMTPRDALVAMKRGLGRPVDLVDLAFLAG